MRLRPNALPGTLPLLAGACLAVVNVGCERSGTAEAVEEDRFFEEPAKVIEATRQVRMSGEPTAFLRLHSDSSIHWQPWSTELFENAEAEQRPIFVLIGSGRYEAVPKLLRDFEESPGLVRALHDHYLCALADVEAHPELGLLAARLSAEIRRPVSFPFMAWFSYEGNPVAWLPLGPTEVEDFAKVWESSHAMVSRIWRQSPRYVIFNSRRDNANRSERLPLGDKEPVDRDTAYANAFGAAARIGSLFDPTSGSIDRSGGLVPTTPMQFCAAAALDPGATPALQSRLKRLLEGTGDAILRGAIRDPLDGGLFLARRGRGWSLPVPIKDATTQSNGIIAFARINAILGGEDRLAAARRFADYTRKTFVEGGEGLGNYLSVGGRTPDGTGFLWSQERLKELLPPDEFEAASAAFGTKGLGNIPPEADPKRLFFRRNALGMSQSPAETAAALGKPESDVRELLDSAAKRLLAQRRELLQRVDDLFLEPTRITAVNAHHASALLALAQATGDEALVTEAAGLLAYLKANHYREDRGLARIAATDRHRGVAARGYDYAALLAALFHLYRHDLDPAHLQWAEALAAEAMEKLGDDKAVLLETPPEDRIGILPITNETMVFGSSTWGTIYAPLGRLQLLGPRSELEDLLAAIRAHLDPRLVQTPLVHTDFAEAVLSESRRCLVLLEGPRDDPAFQELHRAVLAPEFDSATVIHLAPGLPETFTLPEPGGTVRARILRNGEDAGEAANAADLQELLRKALASG